MPESLDIVTYLELAEHFPVADVRTPAEYRQGHIPGAANIPLFSNEERALVGTIYKQKSPRQAFDEGLRITGPKMVEYVKQARELARDNTLMLYCWRGGMRSGSMGWLFETAGMRVYLLQGGYKAFRRHVRESLARPARLIVVGGMTGSGKTEILHHLREMGEQVIDLEGLAHHKGSAFGALGQPDQPSTEHFENLLFDQWKKLDPQRPIWVEDESRSVGKVFIPEELFRQMSRAPLLDIHVGKEYRIDRLVRDYALFDPAELSAAIRRIEKRLGGLNTRICIEAIEAGDFRKATDILLEYYDKSYRHTMSRRQSDRIIPVDLKGNDPRKHAQVLIEMVRSRRII